MKSPVSREILIAFWKVHVLHHAESRTVYGLWLLEELAEHGYRPSPGTLYPLLARMERNGWLRAVNGERAHARRNYRITREGRRVLKVLREDIRELYREVVIGIHPRPGNEKKVPRKRHKGRARLRHNP